jgi:uncharacterized membrane protein YdjX (TVP38/TMEM64 family)
MRRLRLLIFLLVLVALVFAAWQLPLERLMTDLQAWVADNPRWSFLALAGFIAVGILLMLPASLLMMLSGFLFGIAKGFAAVWLATLFASTGAFLLARTFARPMVERRIARKASFGIIDKAIRRKGFFVVLLTRLILVLPFPALNYTHGLTDVRLRDYVLGTMIGMVPAILLFVYLGTLAADVADIIHGRVTLEGGHLAAVVAGTAVVLVAAVLIGLAARKALRAELARAAEDG